MAAGRKSLILCLLVQHFVLLQGAKILTVCLAGGSHYLWMDKISRILHNNGHEVTMFRQTADNFLPGYRTPDSPYRVVIWSMDETSQKEFIAFFKENMKLSFMGGHDLSLLDLMAHLSSQCKMIFNQTSIINLLKEEKYDIAVIDSFNPCSFLVSEKLGIPFIATHPFALKNAWHSGIPNQLSYVPVFQTQLTDHMDFFERVKNVLMYIGSRVEESKIHSLFDDVIEEHFPAGSRPTFVELYKKTALWMYNTDFTFEFSHPFFPNVLYIGGLLAKPANPVSQELEDFISQSGEHGFIIVAFGSMVSSSPFTEFVKEMNDGFAKIPQKVIWRYRISEWPKEVQLAPNVKIMDWISQNDLLGHPKARLLVTHGGINSVQEAIYHGVPMVAIPLFGDQFDNAVRIKAKHLGTFILPGQLKAEDFANAIRHVIEDESYKNSAMHFSLIQRSQPFPKEQQIVRWVEHIVTVGGANHLIPYSYQQPLYQQYLLDVILFVCVCFIGACYLTVKVLRLFIQRLCSVGKLKQN
ncbi:UDP glycosyltransferase 3 family, polypeptide A2 precursor [Xenopus tropicalis]|uniref:UDP-glucuronosyltransferase n=1 Tax=Xenopus tropicalis TaxID=8364 RepID=A0A8J0PD78_XENTR|nr:UDP glycosyltransferase 3 family, polypeptide A2 precursor [Xenopus tropicalis]|eukprot:NP_001005027.3 UDP glycosyltransferase 3 family, polypeptide A2 precursor [Xenopus tropicalis]